MTFGYTAGKKLKFVANVMVVCGGFASIAEVLPVHAFDLWWRHVELPHTTRSSAQLHNIVRSEQDVFCSASLLPSRHRSQIRWPDLLASSSSGLQLTGYLITETMNKCFGSGGGDLLLEATSCARLSLWRPLARWHPTRPADPITQVACCA